MDRFFVPRRFRFIGILVLAGMGFLAVRAGFGSPAGDRGRWPLAAEDSTAEGAVWGELSNGVRYVVLPMRAEERAVSVRLVADVGSAMDPAGKRGMAQLVSRMALNGTRNFSREELMAFFISVGAPFFSEAFAETQLWRTVYRLDLAAPDGATFGRGLDLMADVAGGLAMQESELALERTMVDRQLSYGSGDEAMRAERALFASSSRIGGAGEVSAIASVGLAEAEAFWREWYTADRLTVVVVGAVNAPAVVTALESRFGELKASGAAAEKESPGKLRGKGGVDVIDSRGFTTRAALSYVGEPVDPFAAETQRRLLGLRVLGAYAQSAHEGDGLLNDDVVALYRQRPLLELKAFGSPMTLQDILKSFDFIAHRLSKNGVSAELGGRLLREYREEQGFSVADTPAQEAENLVRSVITGEPYRTGAEHLRFLDRVLPSLDVEYLSGLSREVFDPKRYQLVLEIPSFMGLRSKDIEKGLKGMRKGYNYAWGADGRPVSDWQVKQGFGESGMVVSTKRSGLGDYHLLQYAFQNSFRMNLLQTDGPAGSFRARLSIGNGVTDLESAFPGASYFGRSMLGRMRMGQEKSSALTTVLSGKGLRSVEVGASLGQLHVSVAGRTEEDLQAFLALVTEWIFVTRATKEEFDAVMEQAKALTKRVGESLAVEREDFVRYGEDPRLRTLMSAEEVEAVTLEQVTKWINQTLASGYMELTVVGNIEPRRAQVEARKTLGALPKREGKVMQPRHGTPARLGQPGTKTELVEWKSDRAMVSMSWALPGEDGCVELQRRESLLKLLAIFTEQETRAGLDLLEGLRFEQCGEALAPGSLGVMARFRCPAGETEAAVAAAKALVDRFQEWLSPEIIAAAAKGALADRARTERSRFSLLENLDQSQGRPSWLDCYQKALADNPAIFEAEAFAATSRSLLAADRARVVVVKPTVNP